MTEIRTDPKTVAQEYRQLPPADKAVFRTILELAILAEPDKLPPVVQRALDAGFHDLADEIDRRRNRIEELAGLLRCQRQRHHCGIGHGCNIRHEGRGSIRYLCVYV